MLHARMLALTALTLILAACGGAPQSDPNAVNQAAVNHVTVQLFSAPWCQSCKQDVPAIDQAVSQALGANRSFVTMQLWVTTGGKVSDPPTSDIATAYTKFLNVTAAPMVDEWPWKHFQDFFPAKPFILPAAALLDASGKTIKAWQSGRTSFVPQDIANFIASQVMTPNPGN